MLVDTTVADNPQAWNDAISAAARILHAAGRPKSAAVLTHLARPIYPQDDGLTFDMVRPQYRAMTSRLSIACKLASAAARTRPYVADVVGILSSRTMRMLAGRVRNGRLCYDGYDLEFIQLRPAHLIVETTALSYCFGWEHALTLSDPSATAELAALVRKAHSAGINCVLLHDKADYRFPLVSRITELFHHVISDVNDIIAALDQAAPAPEGYQLSAKPNFQLV